MTLSLLISLLGLPCGIFLYLMTKEEFKDGKKYFILIKNILFFSLIFISIFFFVRERLMIQLIIILVLAIIIYFINQKIKNQYIIFLPYLLFIITYLLSNNLNFRLLIASLIFLFGLPTGTLFYQRLENDIKKRA